MKIAIFSSWSHTISDSNKQLAQDIGRYFAEKNITAVTGGCSGIPAIVIESTHQHNGKTIGYFPVRDHGHYTDSQHLENIHDIQFYSQANFVEGFTARSLQMIKNVDAAIVLNGRIGTLSEFGIAVEEGLPLGIIEGTGGITDELKTIVRVAQKEFPSNEVIFGDEYKKVIDMLIENYHAKK